MNTRQPVLFLGHGDPMNAIRDNTFTQSLNTLGESLAVRPAAILMISAHWLSRGTVVSSAKQPETIYDFGGFPDELYARTYPAAGSPSLAKHIADLLPGAVLDPDRGLDHGGWTVLCHLFPKADIPVVSLGIPYGLPPEDYLAIGHSLRILRDENVLIVGSGNMVHNVGRYFQAKDDEPFDWAVTFDAYIAKALSSKDAAALANYASLGRTAELAHPTNDHLLPLFYCAGAAYPEDAVTFTHEEVVRSMSMRCVRFG